MTTDSHNTNPHPDGAPPSVELPARTFWPFVLSFGLLLLAAGIALGLALSVVGFILFLIGLVGWMRELLPGRGHTHEPLAEPDRQPQPIAARPGAVELLRPGMPGYRLRLPEKIHPISAGVKGGLVGGLLMPIPALLYGLISGRGLFYPVNLLAGLVLPGMQNLDAAELGQFNLSTLR